MTTFRYNTKEVKGNNGFTLTVEPKDLNSIDEDPKLRICTTYTGERVFSFKLFRLSSYLLTSRRKLEWFW